jgi:hypothetical protein
MSGLTGLSRTLQTQGTSYGDLNAASEVYDTSVLDNWRDSKNDIAVDNQEKDAQGEAYLGFGFGEYSGYKALKGIAKKGYELYKKRGTTDENNDGAGDGEGAEGELQFDSMPDAEGFEILMLL